MQRHLGALEDRTKVFRETRMPHSLEGDTRRSLNAMRVTWYLSRYVDQHDERNSTFRERIKSGSKAGCTEEMDLTWPPSTTS